jgi:DNA-binding transcriptional MerR regulator
MTMAKKKSRKGGRARKGEQKKLYTLTEVAKKTGISLPTLQRYKKEYQDRIPSVGEGRKQRYPEEALSAMKEIKKENLKRRGRPKKAKKARVKRARAGKRGAAARKPKRKATKPAATRGRSPSDLLSLSEIGRRTGISYPTLLRYVKQHLGQIPHQGRGRKRRYPREAIAVFERLRRGSKRGRPRRKAAAAAGRRIEVSSRDLGRKIQQLEKAQREISRQLEAVIKQLKKPLQVTISSD